MALLNFFNRRGYPGSLVTMNDVNGVPSPCVIKAVTVVDQAGAPDGQLPTATDRSGSATTSSAQIAAANSARRGLRIQNVGANNIGINEFGGTAAIGSAGTYTLTPGSQITIYTSRAITAIAATATTAFTATEW